MRPIRWTLLSATLALSTTALTTDATAQFYRYKDYGDALAGGTFTVTLESGVTSTATLAVLAADGSDPAGCAASIPFPGLGIVDFELRGRTDIGKWTVSNTAAPIASVSFDLTGLSSDFDDGTRPSTVGSRRGRVPTYHAGNSTVSPDPISAVVYTPGFVCPVNAGDMYPIVTVHFATGAFPAGTDSIVAFKADTDIRHPNWHDDCDLGDECWPSPCVGGSGLTPNIGVTNAPQDGGPFGLRVMGTPFVPKALLIGVTTLEAELSFAGMPGCWLQIAPITSFTLPGSPNGEIVIPIAPLVPGFDVMLQAIDLDPSATTTAAISEVARIRR